MKHQHYFKNVKHLAHIDVYRVLDLFGVTDNALGHAAKKIICAGTRGAKDQSKDVQEAIDTLQRWQEMQAENMAAAESFHKESPREPLPDWQDKELPSSGIYDDDSVTLGDVPAKRRKGFVAEELRPLLYSDAGYTEQDMQAASLVDKDGWIRHFGDKCPIADGELYVEYKARIDDRVRAGRAGRLNWQHITHWRYEKKDV